MGGKDKKLNVEVKPTTPSEWEKVKQASTSAEKIKACRCGGYGDVCPRGLTAKGSGCCDCQHDGK